mmetsp:Transcript_46129/g.108715  ORF Transcript_46129/g.108715 Transcript_46129/m.108715 type:complete len:262 (+) Transcript_46129:40-825(+)
MSGLLRSHSGCPKCRRELIPTDSTTFDVGKFEISRADLDVTSEEEDFQMEEDDHEDDDVSSDHDEDESSSCSPSSENSDGGIDEGRSAGPEGPEGPATRQRSRSRQRSPPIRTTRSQVGVARLTRLRPRRHEVRTRSESGLEDSERSESDEGEWQQEDSPPARKPKRKAQRRKPRRRYSDDASSDTSSSASGKWAPRPRRARRDTSDEECVGTRPCRTTRATTALSNKIPPPLTRPRRAAAAAASAAFARTSESDSSETDP